MSLSLSIFKMFPRYHEDVFKMMTPLNIFKMKISGLLYVAHVAGRPHQCRTRKTLSPRPPSVEAGPQHVGPVVPRPLRQQHDPELERQRRRFRQEAALGQQLTSSPGRRGRGRSGHRRSASGSSAPRAQPGPALLLLPEEVAHPGLAPQTRRGGTRTRGARDTGGALGGGRESRGEQQTGRAGLFVHQARFQAGGRRRFGSLLQNAQVLRVSNLSLCVHFLRTLVPTENFCFKILCKALAMKVWNFYCCYYKKYIILLCLGIRTLFIFPSFLI